MLKEYIVADLEMTGLNPKNDRILEIGAVKITDGEVVDTFSHLVNPKIPVSESVTELTGISDVMAQNGRELDEVMYEFLDFAGDKIWVGHNIIYDYSFVKQWMVNKKIPFERKAVDTLKIARKCLPELESKSLDFLCEYYQIQREHAHRALEDAEATARVYQILWDSFGELERKIFLPQELRYHPKRQTSITPQQKSYLKELLEYHKIESDMQIDALTRSEASRKADEIIRQYGKIPTALRRTGGKRRS